MRLENIVKKAVVGVAMVVGLGSCATYGGMFIPANSYGQCPPDYNYDKNCKTISNELVCQPRCVYSPATISSKRDFGGANEGPGALDRR